MADIFERNGAKPAREPGRKIGQGALGRKAKLGLEELRTAAGHAPQPLVEPPRAQPVQQPRPAERSR
jgi:hypothetical protein